MKTNKQNDELQKKLGELTKTHSEQMGKLQAQLKEQTVANTKQYKDFNECLKKMQETNSELTKSITKNDKDTQVYNDLQAEKDRARELERNYWRAVITYGCG